MSLPFELDDELLEYIRTHKALEYVKTLATFFAKWPRFIRERVAITCGHALIKAAKEAEGSLGIDADNEATRGAITWLLTLIFDLGEAWQPTWPMTEPNG